MKKLVILVVTVLPLSILFLTLSFMRSEASVTTAFVVNSAADQVDANPGDGQCETAPGNGICTLRAAVQESNAHAGADQILLPAGTYTLTLGGADEEAAATGDLDVNDDLIITGDGLDQSIIDGNQSDRIFDVTASLVISGTTVRNGWTEQQGGAIRSTSDGALTLMSVAVRDSVITETFSFFDNHGGGIYNRGALTITDSLIEGNVTYGRDGGGIYSDSSKPLIIEDTVIGYNVAERYGGGIYSRSADNQFRGLTIQHNNAAGDSGSGGGLYIRGHTFFMTTDGTLRLEASVLQENEATLRGGGLYSAQGVKVFLNNTAILTNSVTGSSSAVEGGGLYIDVYADAMTITHSLIQGNTANDSGGGIYHNADWTGSLTVQDSAIISNSAVYYGGGLYNDSNLVLINTTLSGNKMVGLGNKYGAAIYNTTYGLLSLQNSTIANNNASVGGGIYRDSGVITLTNSIVSNNGGANCFGTINSGGHNLDSEDSCNLSATGDITQTDPLLASMQDNGGSTYTHALLVGSPAIDAGDDNLCPLIDQRYYTRPVDGDGSGIAGCDIGAYEYGSAPAVPALSMQDITVNEGDDGLSVATFFVTMTHRSSEAVTFDYNIQDDTAVAGSDYTAVTSGTIQIDPGQLSQAIHVDIYGDDIYESDETFHVDLTNPVGGTLVRTRGIGTIVNDDDPPGLAIGDVMVVEGSTGSITATMTISLSAISSLPVMVDYATVDGSAVAPGDYTAIPSGTIQIDPGWISQTIHIDVHGDSLYESDEQFYVDLSNPVGATLDRSRGMATIANDDDPPSLIIGDATVVEGDTGTITATITISLSTISGLPVSVDYATVDGTAVAGSDYMTTSGSYSIPDGEAAGQLEVVVLGDLVREGEEVFTLLLSQPVHVTIAKGEGSVVIVDDDGWFLYLPVVHNP